VRERATGGQSGTAIRYLKHEEIVLVHRPQYVAGYAIGTVETNAAEIDPVADYLIDAALAEYETRAAQTVRYHGLVPINPDGAIQQVAFHVGSGGTTTTAARNTEQSPRPYRLRRRVEHQRQAMTTARKLRPRNVARSLKANIHAKPRP
jgi:hypothetical protein